MTAIDQSDDQQLIAAALAAASHTRLLLINTGIRHEAAAAFASQFGDREAMIVADDNTFAAAGRDVCASFEQANRLLARPFIFGPDVYADDWCVEELRHVLQASSAIPVAVGSGTINDLTKLAAHQVGRQYLVVATAAS